MKDMCIYMCLFKYESYHLTNTYHYEINVRCIVIVDVGLCQYSPGKILRIVRE